MRHEIACGELEVGKETIGQRCLLEKVAWETYWSTNWFVSSYKPTHAQQCLQPQDIQNIRQCQFRWQKKQAGEIIALGEQSDCFLSQRQKSAWYRDSEKASGRPLWWWWFPHRSTKRCTKLLLQELNCGGGDGSEHLAQHASRYQVYSQANSSDPRFREKFGGTPECSNSYLGWFCWGNARPLQTTEGGSEKRQGTKCRRETDPASASPGENEMVFWIRGLDKPTPRNFSYRLHSEGDFFQSERCWKPFTRW